MSLKEYILLAIITGIISFLTLVLSIYAKHIWENPKIKGILKVLRLDKKNEFDSKILSDSVRKSLDEDGKGSFLVKNGNLEKRVRLKSSELIKIEIGTIDETNEKVSAISLIEIHDHVIYCYVLGPEANPPKRINGYELCFKKNSK